MATIREVQVAELELIHLFVGICEKERLRYYMLGGTMLGAVRHKGFIPWDDDADFGVPRPDYEHFLQAAKKYLPDYVALNCHQTNPSGGHYCAKLTHTKLDLIFDHYTKTHIEHPGIDIFPLDGMPANLFFNRLHRLRILYHKALYRFAYFDYVDVSGVHREWYKRFLIFIGKHIPVQRLFSAEKCWAAYDQVLKKCPYETAGRLCNVSGAYEFNEEFGKDIFGDGAFYDFEDLKLRGPQEYDFYLTQLYGDYMTPPAKNHRNVHTLITITENNK